MHDREADARRDHAAARGRSPRSRASPARDDRRHACGAVARTGAASTRDPARSAAACARRRAGGMRRARAPVQSRSPSCQRAGPVVGVRRPPRPPAAGRRQRVRYSTEPRPIQCTPSMSKVGAAGADASDPAPSGTSRTCSETSRPTRRPARRARARRRREACATTEGPGRPCTTPRLRLNPRTGHANRILTGVKAPAPARVPGRARVPRARGGQAAARPRDPLHDRRQPGHAGLGQPPARPGRRTNGYDAAVIVLDTPGGLEESMRKIVQKELSLKIPVIVYVAPERSAGRIGGRVDRPGGRRARDGAADEHRLVDADQRGTARTSAPTCGARWSTTPPRRCAASRRSTGETPRGPTPPCARRRT